jgi:hypothetical protein
MSTPKFPLAATTEMVFLDLPYLRPGAVVDATLPSQPRLGDGANSQLTIGSFAPTMRQADQMSRAYGRPAQGAPHPTPTGNNTGQIAPEQGGARA